MRAKVVRDAPRCKMCRHPRAAEINALLARTKSDGDDKLSIDEALAAIAELGVQNPTRDNLKSHFWGKTPHVEIVQDAEVEQVEADLAEAERRAKERMRNAPVQRADVADAIIDLELAVYYEYRLLLKERGDIEPLTADQIRGLIGEKTKRKHSDSQDKLMDALAGGIGQVFEKALSGGPDLPALPEHIEEGEVIAVEDGD